MRVGIRLLFFAKEFQTDVEGGQRQSETRVGYGERRRRRNREQSLTREMKQKAWKTKRGRWDKQLLTFLTAEKAG